MGPKGPRSVAPRAPNRTRRRLGLLRGNRRPRRGRASQQSFSAPILVDVGPTNSVAAAGNFPVLALRGPLLLTLVFWIQIGANARSRSRAKSRSKGRGNIKGSGQECPLHTNLEVISSRTCKPNSVCRFRQDGHSSGPRITARLKRPTRRLWRAEPARVPRSPKACRESLPIWSCSVWGLPCPAHYWSGGALLPHLFTLTWALRPGRYVFCGTFRRINPPLQRTQGRATLPDVIRHTALRSSDFPPVSRRATVRSGCQLIYYSARGYRAVVAHDELRSSQFPVLSSQFSVRAIRIC